MEVKLVNQIFDTGDGYWNKYSCGICVLKMLIVFKKPELQSIPVMALLSQALELGGYIDGVGWRHQTLADVAAFYDVPMSFQKEFYDTPEKKKVGIKVIDSKLNSELSRFSLRKAQPENRGSSMPSASGPVAVSVLKEFNIPDSAHLVVVESVKKLGPLILGYRVVDPYPGRRGNRYIVSKKDFLVGWRGGMIWLK